MNSNTSPHHHTTPSEPTGQPSIDGATAPPTTQAPNLAGCIRRVDCPLPADVERRLEWFETHPPISAATRAEYVRRSTEFHRRLRTLTAPEMVECSFRFLDMAVRCRGRSSDRVEAVQLAHDASVPPGTLRLETFRVRD